MHAVPMKANSSDLTEYFRPRRRTDINPTPMDIDPYITFSSNGQPFSSRFKSFYYTLPPLVAAKDIFFSDFFKTLIEGRTDFSVIGEVGFGTGLNFALACNYWKKGNHPKARLHYIAIEPYPLEADPMDRFLLNFRELDIE